MDCSIFNRNKSRFNANMNIFHRINQIRIKKRNGSRFDDFFSYCPSLRNNKTSWDEWRGASSIGACSVPETNVNGEQIDDSRPWKPRMDQCGEVTLLSAHPPFASLLLPNRRKTCAAKAKPNDIYFEVNYILPSQTFSNCSATRNFLLYHFYN